MPDLFQLKSNSKIYYEFGTFITEFQFNKYFILEIIAINQCSRKLCLFYSIQQLVSFDFCISQWPPFSISISVIFLRRIKHIFDNVDILHKSTQYYTVIQVFMIIYFQKSRVNKMFLNIYFSYYHWLNNDVTFINNWQNCIIL